MIMVVKNLPELVDENQQILGQLLLITMHANGFKVDDVRVEFINNNPDLAEVPF